MLSVEGGVVEVLPCNIGFCPVIFAFMLWQYVSNNTFVTVNVSYIIVFANYSHLIDTKSVLITF